MPCLHDLAITLLQTCIICIGMFSRHPFYANLPILARTACTRIQPRLGGPADIIEARVKSNLQWLGSRGGSDRNPLYQQNNFLYVVWIFLSRCSSKLLTVTLMGILVKGLSSNLCCSGEVPAILFVLHEPFLFSMASHVVTKFSASTRAYTPRT